MESFYTINENRLRQHTIKSLGSYYINVSWERLPRDTRYQIWHWPSDQVSVAQTFSTIQNSAQIASLVPGQSYIIWIIALGSDNRTLDYITLSKTTGVFFINKI